MVKRPERDIDRLRREVRKSQRLAKDKVGRLSDKGVTNLGKFNPVRYDANLDRYTKKQLETYKSQLDSFRSRSRQFVPGARGTAIPAEDYRAYVRQHNRRRSDAQKFFAKVDDTKLPSTGMTFGQARDMSDALGNIMQDQTSTRWDKLEPKRSKQFTSPKALAKEMRRIQRENRKGFEKWQKEAGLRMIKGGDGSPGLLDDRNSRDIVRRLEALSPKQFTVLWNQKKFPDAARRFYLTLKDMLSPEESVFSETVQTAFINSSRRDMLNLLSDVEKMGK